MYLKIYTQLWASFLNIWEVACSAVDRILQGLGQYELTDVPVEIS